MTTEELIVLYVSLKRIFFNKPFLKMPKEDSATWEYFNRLQILLEEKQIPGDEYILVNVRAYRKRNSFPYPSQLIGVRAFNRYSEYVNRKYTLGRLFRTDQYSVLIYATNVYYPIDDLIKPLNKDTRVLLIWTFVREGAMEFDKEKVMKLWESYCYVLAKYEWFKQVPPNSLLTW
jgi:hypothetical protein